MQAGWLGLATVAGVIACGSTVIVVVPEDDDPTSTGVGGDTTFPAGPQGPGTVGPGPGPGPGPGQPNVSVGPSGGICRSGLTTGSDVSDACLSASCCAPFIACLDDGSCEACLLGPGSGCASNTLFRAFEDCLDENCADQICDAGITFSDGNGNPAIDCNICASDFCCSPLAACVGTSTPAEIEDCLECIQDATGSACTGHSTTVQNGASQFNTCVANNCGECDI